MYRDMNNLYLLEMQQKLPVGSFDWIGTTLRFDKKILKNCNEDGEIGSIFLKLVFNNQENYLKLRIVCHFYQKKWKLKSSKNLYVVLNVKKKCFVDKIILEQALNQRLVLQKVHRITKFNEKGCLKPYTDINKELKKDAKI